MPWEPRMTGSIMKPGWVYRQETDWSSEDGARQQADAFRGFWRQRGRDVETTLVCTGPAERPVWGFRSTLGPVGVKR
jgi:hypothetical protein